MNRLDPIHHFATVPVTLWLRFLLLIVCIIFAYMSGTNWTLGYKDAADLLAQGLIAIYAGHLPWMTVPVFCAAFILLTMTDVYPLPILLHLYLFLGIGSLDGFYGWGSVFLAVAFAMAVFVDFILIRNRYLMK